MSPAEFSKKYAQHKVKAQAGASKHNSVISGNRNLKKA
jgi:hypothetical protein